MMGFQEALDMVTEGAFYDEYVCGIPCPPDRVLRRTAITLMMRNFFWFLCDHSWAYIYAIESKWLRGSSSGKDTRHCWKCQRTEEVK